MYPSVRRARRGRVLRLAAAAEGAAAAFLVGRDGTPAWQVIRVLVVCLLTLGAMHALRRPAGRAASAAAFAAGLLGVSVGIGVGAMHVVKGGAPEVAVAGSICLVAGVILAIGGAAWLIRSVRRKWRRLLVGIALGGTAFALVFPTWPAFYVTNVPRPSLGSATPADHGIEFREIWFSTPDGVRLSGWYIPSRNRAAVVVLHGASSTRSAVLAQSVALARHGYGVLLYDARGHGRSQGRAMDFGWYGDHDISGAVSYLEAQSEIDPRRIGAVGLSMGGEQVIGAAAHDPRLRAAVAEGATGRTGADLAWLSHAYGARGSLTELWQGILEYGLTDLLTEARPPTSLHDAAALASPRRLLLITAGEVGAEHQAAAYIRSAAPGSVDVWQVDGAGHTHGLQTSPREWEGRVLRFLDAALLDEEP
jgi:pimeloyl-ACP methyl ester carboxylesterase